MYMYMHHIINDLYMYTAYTKCKNVPFFDIALSSCVMMSTCIDVVLLCLQGSALANGGAPSTSAAHGLLQNSQLSG